MISLSFMPFFVWSVEWVFERPNAKNKNMFTVRLNQYYLRLYYNKIMCNKTTATARSKTEYLSQKESEINTNIYCRFGSNFFFVIFFAFIL